MQHGSGARPWRVVLYSHDSIGLGHVRRNIALAHSLAEHLPILTGREVTGLLLSGLDSITRQLPVGFDHVSLPGITKVEGAYAPRQVSVSMRHLLSVRSQLLTAAITSFGPDLLIVDRHPFGVDGELTPALAELRRQRPETRIVLGLREVLDDPDTAATEWSTLGDLRDVRNAFDDIWLFGDRTVHDAVATGEIPAELADLVHHAGYLSVGRWADPAPLRRPKPYVLTMVGGGSDGESLCSAAAQAPVPAGHRHLVVTGPQMPATTRRRIRAAANEDTDVVETVPDGLTTIRGAEAAVSMAGYNTVVEVMSTTTPHLLVPRAAPRQEQLIRARGLAAAGVAELLAPKDLSPAAIGEWFAGAVGRSVDRSMLRRDGLAESAHRAVHLLHSTPLQLVARGSHRTTPIGGFDVV